MLNYSGENDESGCCEVQLVGRNILSLLRAHPDSLTFTRVVFLCVQHY